MTQRNKKVVLEKKNCAYLEGMSHDVSHMVFVFTNWGNSDLDWLQHGVCQGSCSETNTLSTIKHLEIKTTDI